MRSRLSPFLRGEPMTTTQWVIGLGVTLIAGGAMGALISAYVSYKRNKRQPVVYTMEIIDIFRKGTNFPRLAKLMVTEHPLGFGEERSVDNLSLARIKVTNKGNQDIKEFTFGSLWIREIRQLISGFPDLTVIMSLGWDCLE